MQNPVLVAGARTPIGRLLGSLASHTAPDLGTLAIREALARAGLTGDDVDAVVMGNVVQAGVGPNPARIAAAGAEIPMSVPATTVNKLCLSGLAAIAQAAQLVAVGQCSTVVAGGMESMTNAPHLVPAARRGFKYGSATVVDALDKDALTCAFDQVAMGAATEHYQVRFGLSRAEQDEYAAESHARAAAAAEADRFAEEITPVTTSDRKGRTHRFDQDEGVRPEVTVEQLSKLRPAFAAGGTVTAGSSSQLSDGGCAVVVMSKERARDQGVGWLAEIGAYGTVAGPDPSLLLQPANAIEDALRRDGGLTPDELDAVEINEAFAGVPLVSSRQLGIPMDRVNVNGGAIALGHPVGMSGGRLVMSLALELHGRGGGAGAAALCGGGGQGDALLLRVPNAES